MAAVLPLRSLEKTKGCLQSSWKYTRGLWDCTLPKPAADSRCMSQRTQHQESKRYQHGPEVNELLWRNAGKASRNHYMLGLLSETRCGSDFSLRTKIRLITILKITWAVPKKILTVQHKRNAQWELWSILASPAPVPHPQKNKNTHIRRIQEVSHFAKEQTMSPLSLSPAELTSWAPVQESQCLGGTAWDPKVEEHLNPNGRAPILWGWQEVGLTTCVWHLLSLYNPHFGASLFFLPLPTSAEELESQSSF